MKLINASYEIVHTDGADRSCTVYKTKEDRLEDLMHTIYRAIEIAGRTCYKSEDKITETSAKEFVQRMIDSKHYAMLEHGTVYLVIPLDADIAVRYTENAFSFCRVYGDNLYITTNYRVLVENEWLDDMQYASCYTQKHERRIMVKFICDRGVSHEFVRHRVFSFAQESTRYCNYSKDKFGNELTFIEPFWYNNKRLASAINTIGDNEEVQEQNFNQFLHYCERQYFKLLKQSLKPQEARAVLPNALKTELVMTGFVSDWKHFFELRDAKTAHPDAQALAKPLHDYFIATALLPKQ